MKTAAATLLHDTHSKLSRSRPARLLRPTTLDELLDAVRAGGPIIASGSRHAMGGQQFLHGGTVLDLRGLNRVLSFDADTGEVEVEAGMEWPALLAFLRPTPWAIVQKQTGADRLTLGGAVAANIHGRGLALRPFVQDLLALTLVDARGELVRCSRTENAELFRLVVGGYGLFGVVYAVRLQLNRRHTLRRSVRLVRAEEVIDAFAERIAAGSTYGDWQFAIDHHSADFLNHGILSAYAPCPQREFVGEQHQLSEADWRRLLLLAHTDKTRAFTEYTRHYLRTDGQFYESDAHQFGTYVEDYHTEIDAALGAKVPGSEMISELYVPREKLAVFLAHTRTELRRRRANVIYGTVRLIERDTETFLAWAREPWACVIFNLHVDHHPRGIARAREQFRALIDAALACGGTYYLTYHRWATRAQLRAAYPQLPAFLAAKRRYDPGEVFKSDWSRALENHE